ncbi:Bll5565 protein [hydrothermal vent metagenome]|uniref:Bll5565 protein n=1 Tax=hydrothermal vent metagenome TaxID=652676 RepID=A0A1W1BTS1_9ZZZZ
MGFLEKIVQRLLIAIQFVLVFLFILFEEIVWEGLAKPIYDKIASLRILIRLEKIITLSNRYIVLLFFTTLLLGVEGAGLLAGLFFVQGKVLLGTALYIVKIPIAGFTFWLFKVAKPKLLSFDWFALAYNKLMNGIDWLKDTTIYKKSMSAMLDMKSKIKLIFKNIKERYFFKDSRFVEELKSFYSYIKNFKNRKKND